MDEPDRGLAERARRGDREALAALYECHKAGLLGFLIHLIGDRDSAEDVFQEVWAKVIRQVSRYDVSRAPFRAWLFQIGANTAIDHLRKRRRWRRRIDGSDGAEVKIARAPTTDPLPDASSLIDSEVESVRLAMKELSDAQRSAICMRHLAGASYREIASTLGVPEGTAKTLVHRGILLLKEALQERSHE